MAQVAVIIPTYNGNQYLVPCIQSILRPLETEDLVHIYLVNNGDPANVHGMEHPKLTILQQDSNLGWEGGLKVGLEASKEPFVIFMNDDTFVPFTSINWVNRMLDLFSAPNIGAVGPSSNFVMGAQNMLSPGIPDHFDIVPVNFLIGFCLMVRREALEKAGGIDDMLPGGDDLDLSIRLRKAGYMLLINRNVFVYHHGCKTGERVNGGPEVAGGWNSVQMTEKTNWALIKKHGLREWISCMNQVIGLPSNTFGPESGWQEGDLEGNMIAELVGEGSVLEVGCGMKKTVPQAIGLDRVAAGEQIPGVSFGLKSKADIIGNAEGPIPVEDGRFDYVIARHVLEHIPDFVKAIKEWRRVLKSGGKAIIAVPNHELRNSIPMNIEHVHGWTPDSLRNFMESQGWKTVDLLDPKNAVSFVGVFEANGHGLH